MTETVHNLIAAYRLDEARAAVLAAYAYAQTAYRADTPQYIEAQLLLGRWHLAAGEYAAAEPLLKQALAGARQQDDALLSAAQQAQAQYWNETGQFDKSAQLLAGSDLTPEGRIEYGSALLAQGSLNEALAQYEAAAAACLAQHGMQHVQTARAYVHAAAVYRIQGYAVQAQSVLSGCLDILRRHAGREHPYTAAALAESAAACAALGRFGQAERLYRRVCRALEHSLGSRHPLFGRALLQQADFFGRRGQNEQALSCLQQALPVFWEALGEEHPLVFAVIRRITLLLVQQWMQAE